ncbi:MAG: DNA/RNA nuclease SfsA [Firmicutes bacterium]|nr:DNA/RNA nuclease SfsA [Bacillota bacterium]
MFRKGGVCVVRIAFDDLARATFIERPNRFIVRCRLQETGEEVEAHLADPGRLKELLLPGAVLYLRFAAQAHRKTKWSAALVLAPDGQTLVSLQATMANRLAAQAMAQKKIPALANWDLSRAEYSFAGSRFDFYLQNQIKQEMLLEVKSCTLVHDGVAMFPDAVTARGKRHVQELTRLQRSGEFETAILFVVQRADGQIFRPASQIDPAFSKALKEAYDQGVEVLVYQAQVDLAGITWGQQLPTDFS